MERQEKRSLLNIGFWSAPGGSFNSGTPLAIREQLCKIPSISQALEQGILSLNNISTSSKKLLSNPIKRKIKRLEDA